jgi:hypothetical protein
VVARALQDAGDQGARFAFGIATDEGLPLYEQFGAQTVESWTYFTGTA